MKINIITHFDKDKQKFDAADFKAILNMLQDTKAAEHEDEEEAEFSKLGGDSKSMHSLLWEETWTSRDMWRKAQWKR